MVFIIFYESQDVKGSGFGLGFGFFGAGGGGVVCFP